MATPQSFRQGSDAWEAQRAAELREMDARLQATQARLAAEREAERQAKMEAQRLKQAQRQADQQHAQAMTQLANETSKIQIARSVQAANERLAREEAKLNNDVESGKRGPFGWW